MIEWDERKRAANLAKHGLDFADAWQVYESSAKVTFESARKAEIRKLDVAPVEDLMLAFVYAERRGRARAISLRRASRAERRMYGKAIEEKPY
ncbi:MAG: BrnT family toxin [Betaproteobacteria bacterium]